MSLHGETNSPRSGRRIQFPGEELEPGVMSFRMTEMLVARGVEADTPPFTHAENQKQRSNCSLKSPPHVA
jgi:hypothetical protein